MKTSIRLGLFALALAAPASIVARAGDPAVSQSKGTVLILDNERTLEGEIQRQGEQYHLRRSLGEVWIPRENVLRVCSSYAEAYEFLRTRSNLKDPDEHLRLAQWCQRHGLRKEALAEVSAAVELRPNHAESRRLLRNLQQSTLLQGRGNIARPHDTAETTAA